MDPSDCEKLTLRHTARSRSDIVRSGPSDPLRRVQGQFLTENPIPASDWSPGTLRTHKIGRARRGPIWGHVGGGLFSGRYRTYQPVLLTTSPARATARVRRPDFRFFCFCGSYGDFRSLRTIREAGLWAMRRLKCPGHSDCAQIATWWPPDDAMASVPREVPRDRGTRVHTPSHCPGASFGRTLGGGCQKLLSTKRRFWDLATSSTGFEYTRAVRDPRSGEPGQGRPSPDPTWPPTPSLRGRAV